MTQIDHGFDGEHLRRTMSLLLSPEAESKTYHAGFHRANSLVLRVVRDVGRGVEEVVDAVSAIRAHDRATILSCNWLTVCGSRGRVVASTGEVAESTSIFDSEDFATGGTSSSWSSASGILCERGH